MLKNLSSIDRAGADFQSSKMSKKRDCSKCFLVQADQQWCPSRWFLARKNAPFFCQCHICWPFCFSRQALFFWVRKKKQSTPMIFGPSQALRWSRSSNFSTKMKSTCTMATPCDVWGFERVPNIAPHFTVDRKIPLIPGALYHRSTNITG